MPEALNFEIKAIELTICFTKLKKLMKKKIVIMILIVIWMGVVFSFSNQGATESSGVSGKVTERIVDSLHITEGCNQEDAKIVLKNIENIVRKIEEKMIAGGDASRNHSIVFCVAMKRIFAVLQEFSQQ